MPDTLDLHDLTVTLAYAAQRVEALSQAATERQQTLLHRMTDLHDADREAHGRIAGDVRALTAQVGELRTIVGALVERTAPPPLAPSWSAFSMRLLDRLSESRAAQRVLVGGLVALGLMLAAPVVVVASREPAAMADIIRAAVGACQESSP